MQRVKIVSNDYIFNCFMYEPTLNLLNPFCIKFVTLSACYFAIMYLYKEIKFKPTNIGSKINWSGIQIIWASMRENLSSGFPTKLDSNRPAQLQTLARILKCCMKQV